MSEGVPVARQFFLVTQRGEFVVDWGNGIFQDIYTGKKVFLEENEYTYMAKDSELMMLKQNLVINDFDKYTVFLYPMDNILDS
jgi:hypothetical protein